MSICATYKLLKMNPNRTLHSKWAIIISIFSSKIIPHIFLLFICFDVRKRQDHLIVFKHS